ncbi:hypothetical protein EV426DRAFT_579100 [Tirmania nivea]|nr:hypothetical protein EV426DRAFT_579100 [Tirmania nivea]
MVNPKLEPTRSSGKCSRAHQTTNSSCSKIAKSEPSSTTEPETPGKKASVAKSTRTPTAASRKIAARQQTPKRLVSKSTDRTDANSGSEFELPVKSEKNKTPNSRGKIAARPPPRKPISRESSTNFGSGTVHYPTRKSHFFYTNFYTPSGLLQILLRRVHQGELQAPPL